MSPFWCDYRWGLPTPDIFSLWLTLPRITAVCRVLCSDKSTFYRLLISSSKELLTCSPLLGPQNYSTWFATNFPFLVYHFFEYPVHCLYHPTKCQLSPRLYILTNHKPRKPSPSRHVTLVFVVSRYVLPSICSWCFIGFECLVTCESVSISLFFYSSSSKILKCSPQMSFSSPVLSMPLHQDILRISG